MFALQWSAASGGEFIRHDLTPRTAAALLFCNTCSGVRHVSSGLIANRLHEPGGTGQTLDIDKYAALGQATAQGSCFFVILSAARMGWLSAA